VSKPKNKAILEEMKKFFKVDSIEDVAEKLGYKRTTATTWRSKGVTDNVIARYKNLIYEKNINNQGNYIKSIGSNEGYIVQDKHTSYNSQAAHDNPRAKTLLDKFNTLSEIGKIEAENCINTIYLKELKENDR